MPPSAPIQTHCDKTDNYFAGHQAAKPEIFFLGWLPHYGRRSYTSTVWNLFRYTPTDTPDTRKGGYTDTDTDIRPVYVYRPTEVAWL